MTWAFSGCIVFQALLQHNAKVYIATRSPEKAWSAIQDPRQQTGKEAIYLKLDLSGLRSVKVAAEEFTRKEKELHVLFNNAGVMAPPIDQVTAQGYDLQFGTNVLDHFYFTKLLLPVLLATAKNCPERRVRVINTSSSGHLFGSLDFNTFKDSPARRIDNKQSGVIVFSNELSRRYKDEGIVSIALNPGNFQSDLWRHVPRLVTAIFQRVITYPASYGALTQLYAGTSPDGVTLNGKYLIPWGRVGDAARSTDDLELGKQLWMWLEEQVMMVTGGTTGIGKETVKALLQHNAKVYIAARNPEKARLAIDDLRRQTGKEALFLELDLSDLRSVKAAVYEFIRKALNLVAEKELHVLFNNAGVLAPPMNQLTAQGHDLQFGTNVVGHFYLTKLLLPTLLATAKTTPSQKVRVVNTSSSAHLLGSLNFNTFRGGRARRWVHPHLLYAQSKYGNVVFSNVLARRFGDQGIVSVSLNPGNLHSDLWRHTSRILAALIALVTYPTPYGALTQLYAGTCPEGVGFNGKYLTAWARLSSPARSTEDPQLGKELWAWVEEHVKNI
ncbi:hypothetical protein AX16_008099 [Volvariella volvacea WC 439]|nr:hypothetical protein AX16_008099 [Volvariella volvacea WC 439]